MTILHHPTDQTLIRYASGALPQTLELVVACHLTICPHCRHRLRWFENIGAATLRHNPGMAMGENALATVLHHLTGNDDSHGSTGQPHTPAENRGAPDNTATAQSRAKSNAEGMADHMTDHAMTTQNSGDPRNAGQSRAAGQGMVTFATDRQPAGTRANPAAIAPDLPILRPLAAFLPAHVQNLDDLPWKMLAPGIRQYRLKMGKGRGSARLIKAAPGVALPDHGHHGHELTLVLRGAFADEYSRYHPGDVADLDQDVQHTPRADTEGECICLLTNDAPLRFRGLLPRLLQPFIRI